ncbi:MAG TPA: prephenate dehydrogenase/arogenate dehydrogenase family protein [Candidatus Acidoferrum sp.]|nr:prephenate dehydrogenase/arogenate dehydrogenase family protein [Candidatus Acidoferrum sp.]
MSPIRRVAILGTGLIGGSFGLALRKCFPDVSVVGFDRADTLRRAADRSAVRETAATIRDAVRGADLIYVALPIGVTIEALPEIAAAAGADALVTDTCSTKATVCHAAQNHFKAGPRFLGGHPMAGKETSGIENADAEIFAGAPYALIGSESDGDARAVRFAELLRRIGAKPVWCDADTHDWAVGIVSHLPQLVALALTRVVTDETDETGLPLTLAGKGLQDTLRLAASPYSVWRDIFLTNRENITHALDRLAQAVDHLRTRLASKELEQEFQVANALAETLRTGQIKPER